MGYGDELMVSGQARVMQRADPRKVRLDYGKPLWMSYQRDVFANNPRIAVPDDPETDVQVYRPRGMNGLRPYCTGKTPDKWTWTKYKPEAGELYFTPEELKYAEQFSPDVIIEPNLKPAASPNKDWGARQWKKLIEQMRRSGMHVSQLGTISNTQIYEHAHLIKTETFRLAAAVLARARAAVLTEGGLHHVAAAVGVRAVVIYGGFISPEQTGYDMHENIFTGGTPCGNRMRCDHCQQAMKAITPDMVMERLMRIRSG